MDPVKAPLVQRNDLDQGGIVMERRVSYPVCLTYD
jgi:hypothetical protein